MFSLSFAIVMAALFAYRVLLLSVPVFAEAVKQHPLLNILCGALSDVFLAGALYLLWALLASIRTAKWQAVVRAVLAALTAGLVAFLMTHLRYVEHFGMTLRPFHLKGLQTGEVWGAGTFMVFESWRCVTLIVATLTLGGLIYRYRPSWGQGWTLKKRLTIALLVIAACNSLVIRLRHLDAVHWELRYNALTAAYFNNLEYSQIMTLPKPSPETLKTVRQLLHGPRDYADPSGAFPIWQRTVPLPAAADPSRQALREALMATVKKGVTDTGKPWNVVLIMSESLRAKELNAFGLDEPRFATLSPQLDRIAADGVRFTGTIGVGMRTHYGQTATMCSLFGADDFSILNAAPMSNAVCLPDIFASRGYDTSFFYAGDNSFDHQNIFYQFHRTARIYGQQDMPESSAKGGWGYSDHALFNFAHEKLQHRQSDKPFFSVILTLTNHSPLQLPADVPPGVVDPEGLIRDQLISYVDWALGEFYDQMRRTFPQTLFVFIADHGRNWDEPPPVDPLAGSYVWQTARIPWIIVVPDAPAGARGVVVDTLASNVDVPPTLLNLLGWSQTPQQFMGEDAFSRTGPAYLDWSQTLLELRSARPKSLQVRQLTQDIENVLGAMGRFNLIAPPRRKQQLPGPD